MADACRLLAYGVLVVSCLAAYHIRRRERTLARFLLLGATLAAVALTIAEAVELGSLLSGESRRLAGQEGWYGERRTVQAFAIAVSVFFGVTGGALAVWKSWKEATELAPLILAYAALLTFLFVRAVSLHQLDAVLYGDGFGGLLGVWLETGMVVAAAAGAIWATRPFGGRAEDRSESR